MGGRFTQSGFRKQALFPPTPALAVSSSFAQVGTILLFAS